MLYDLTSSLHEYKPTVQPVASRSLFLDNHVVTHLLGEITIFVCKSPLPNSLRLNFSTIFIAHLCVYTHMMGCKRSFREI